MTEYSHTDDSLSRIVNMIGQKHGIPFYKMTNEIINRKPQFRKKVGFKASTNSQVDTVASLRSGLNQR